VSSKIVDLGRYRHVHARSSDPRLTAIYAAIQEAREIAHRRGSDQSRKMLDECETLLRQTYSGRLKA
jgi:hypothetical protein